MTFSDKRKQILCSLFRSKRTCLSARAKVISINNESMKSDCEPEEMVELVPKRSAAIFNTNLHVECVFIPSHLRQISDSAFRNCSSLRSITFSKDSELRIIGKMAFKNTRIETISIPKTVEVIGDECFTICPLRKIVFHPDSCLKKIGAEAFAGTTLETIEIPMSVNYIGVRCFYSCVSLTRVFFHSDSAVTCLSRGLFNKSSIERIIIPKSVTDIGENCFHMCKSLSSVTFENGSRLRTIKRFAFAETGIFHVRIPRSVEVLESECFSGCPTLRIFDFEGDSLLKSIQSCVWANCFLNELSLPASVREIMPGAFRKIRIKGELTVSEKNPFYTSDGILVMEKTRRELVGCAQWQAKFVNIPAAVEIIGPRCFDGCTFLRVVSIDTGSRLKELGDKAFICCPLQDLKIPETTKIFGRSSLAFKQSEKIVQFASNEQRMRVPKDAFRLLL